MWVAARKNGDFQAQNFENKCTVGNAKRALRRCLFVGPPTSIERPANPTFHEDAKTGDLKHQFGARSLSSSKKFWTRMNLPASSLLDAVSAARSIRNR